MKTLSKELIERAVKAKGYKWFEDGQLNIVGIRTNDETPNKFNDYITISYKENNEWKLGFIEGSEAINFENE